MIAEIFRASMHTHTETHYTTHARAHERTHAHHARTHARTHTHTHSGVDPFFGLGGKISNFSRVARRKNENCVMFIVVFLC